MAAGMCDHGVFPRVCSYRLKVDRFSLETSTLVREKVDRKHSHMRYVFKQMVYKSSWDLNNDRFNYLVMGYIILLIFVWMSLSIQKIHFKKHNIIISESFYFNFIRIIVSQPTRIFPGIFCKTLGPSLMTSGRCDGPQVTVQGMLDMGESLQRTMKFFTPNVRTWTAALQTNDSFIQ